MGRRTKVEAGDYDEVKAETFFELLAARHDLGDRHRIYYYYRAVSTEYTAFALLAAYTRGRVRIQRLWVLVNEDIGMVEDYVFRPAE